MESLDFRLEFKSLADDGELEGLAAGYGNVDTGGDRIMPGAATKSLASRPTLPMLLYHDQARPVGVWFDLKETAAGLLAKGRLALTTRDGAEAHTLAKAGALTGLSIGYQIAERKYVGEVRELHAIDVHEVSLVPIPMNDRSRITAVKSLSTKADLVDLLRGSGLAKAAAERIAAGGWKALQGADDDAEAQQLAARIAAVTERLKGA